MPGGHKIKVGSMNKKLKVFLFTFLGVLLVVGLGVGGYFLISNLSTTTIYNVSILTKDGALINDTSRYLLSTTTNNFPIQVSVETDSGKGECFFTSSNPAVAKVVVIDGEYYVQYYKAGTATITAYSRYTTSVYDSFKLNVYDNYVSDIVIDRKTDNLLTAYGDGREYVFDYETTGILENENCNNMQTRVLDNYDTTVIENISINQIDQTITIKSKLVTQDSLQVFYLQTYYVDVRGQEHVVKNHAFTVNVIGFRIDDMQLLVSENYQFKNQTYVYLSDPTTADSAFLLENEKVIADIVLSETVKNLYFKIRVIYSNKTYEDVSFVDSVLPTEIEGSFLNFTGGWALGMNYWFVQMNEEALETASQQTDIVRAFSLSYTDEVVKSSMKKEFKITYKHKDTQSYQDFINKDLYAKVVDSDGNLIRYEYIYWDSRYRRTDTKTDARGNIIGFFNDTPICDESKNITISE